MVLGKSVCFKDQKISFPDGSVRNAEVQNTGPTRRMAPYCVTVKSVSCGGARSDTPAEMQTYTVVHTETITTTKSQCGISRCDQRTAPHCCQPWALLDSRQCVHSLVMVSQKQRAARTASVTNNTCLHTGALLCSRAPGCKDMATKKMETSKVIIDFTPRVFELFTLHQSRFNVN